MNRLRSVLVILLTAVFFSGCALVKVREDVQFSKDSSLLFGEIVTTSPLGKPIFVIAYSMDDGRLSVGDYAVLSEPGPYELLVRQGRYRLFAFEDANGNDAYDPGEWAGHYGKGAPLSPPAGGVAWGLDFEISKDGGRQAPALAGPLTMYSGGKKKHPTSAGAIADLNDPSFSAEQGEKGFWEPLDSFQYTGCSIYFLEPYDPGKIPVLFVHGAAGSPQDWKFFLKALDRSRYQPWIFSYPSGARLETLSFFLRKKLYDLYGKYNFDQLFVVAHSMGGLVSRSALIEQDLHNRSVRLFLSISTPWNGEKRAKTGVEHSPAVIPSWKDMEPDSDFIRHAFSRKIPDNIRYYLFFGHKGGGSLFRENNDNTVTLESMLDPRAQADALKVMGFHDDHVSILSSPEVFQQYDAIAEVTEANLRKTLASSRGYADVRHDFRPPGTKAPLQMSLVLVPTKGDAGETQFKLNPSTPGQETGAIPPGDYEATLCALGFRSEPANLPVSITAGKISDLRFTLVPQGMVAGIITAAAGAADSYWGYLLALSGKNKVRSVTLEGAGIRRSLTPSDGMSEKEVLKTFLSSKDYLCRDGFVFFDLPAGDYTLAIEAEGCEPYTAKVTVKPGEFTPPPPFRLVAK
ncbi:MAG: alpha/beta fold hydrolase [Syntrophales bacterium]